MRMQIIKVCFFCVLAALSACMPILPHVDYVPEMAGGKLLKGSCWQKPSMQYETDGISLTSRIMTWSDDVLRVELLFDIPEGITVELLAPDIFVVSPSGASAVRVRIPGISLNDNPSLPLQAMGQMVGHDVFIYQKKRPRHFWLFVPLRGIDAADMRVTLPTLKVNDRMVTVPEIHFTRHMRVQLVAPVQC